MSCWCGRGDLNYSIALITRNLLILHPGVKAQMAHNPASLVRLLYGERAQKRKPRRSAFSQSFQQQFDTRHSHRPRPRFENPSGHFSRRSSQTGIIAGTGLPLVLISHGTAASEASHYDAVLALADEGFVCGGSDAYLRQLHGPELCRKSKGSDGSTAPMGVLS
jgi:hypothetical protein